MSSIGTVTYETSKELARSLKPLVGNSPHHVKNTQGFIQQIKGIYLNQSQCMMSYDVKAHFTSVPTTPATNIIKKLLKQDQDLNVSRKHHLSSCVLPQQYLLHVPGKIL